MKNYKVGIVIEKDADGYTAFAPSLQGCYTQGETFEEVFANIRDAVALHIEDRLARGEEIPEEELVAVTQLEVGV